MKIFIALFVILFTAMAAAVDNQVQPVAGVANLSWFKTGGLASPPNTYYGYQASYNPRTRGNMLQSSFGHGGNRLFTFPIRTSPYYITIGSARYDGDSTPSSGPSTFVPLEWYSSVVVGSGQSSRHGTYELNGEGVWAPHDEDGNELDPVTLEPVENKFDADFDIENDTDHPGVLDYGWVMIDPETGALMGQGVVSLGPGEKMPMHLTADKPFQWAVYPVYEGQINTSGGPISSGASSGQQGTGPTLPGIYPGNPYTPPTPPPPDAPEGDVQASVDRLADIVQDMKDKNAQGHNTTAAEVRSLKGVTEQLKTAVAQNNTLTSNQTTALTEKLEDLESQIGSMAEGTGGAAGGGIAGINEKLSGVIDAIENMGPGGGPTAEEIGEAVGEALGNGTTPDGALPGEYEGAVDDGEAITNSVEGIREGFGTLQESAEGLVAAVGLDRTYGTTNWVYTITLGPYGTHEVNIEQYGWALDLVRSTIFGCICMHYLGLFFQRLRGALVG